MKKTAPMLLLTTLLLTGCASMDSVKSFFSSDDNSPRAAQSYEAPATDNQQSDRLSEESHSQWRLRYE